MEIDARLVEKIALSGRIEVTGRPNRDTLRSLGEQLEQPKPSWTIRRRRARLFVGPFLAAEAFFVDAARSLARARLAARNSSRTDTRRSTACSETPSSASGVTRSPDSPCTVLALERESAGLPPPLRELGIDRRDVEPVLRAPARVRDTVLP